MERIFWLGPVAAVCVGAGVTPACAEASPSEPAGTAKAVLDNGIGVIVQRAGVADRVAVQAIYEVGFVDEPAGMTQASHLLEHLICMGATDQHGPGEAMTRLNALGLGNAETLGGFTHYDYALPAGEIGLAFRIEASRLSSLQITPELIAQEAHRVYAETETVEKAPGSPLVKHGIMAAVQAWRHGRDGALVRGGLEDIGAERLRDWHRAVQTPDRLTLVVVGDVDPGRVIELAKEHLGRIELPADRAGREPVGRWPVWEGERVREVRWDAAAPAVVLAWPPPEDTAERLAVSVWGNLLTQRLSTDPRVRRVASFAMSTNHVWPAGDLPVFVYATLAPGAAGDEAERVIMETAAEAAARISAAEAAMLLSGINPAAQTAALDPEMVRAQSAQLVRMGMTPERATDAVLAQAALNIGLGERLGSQAGEDDLDRVRAMDAAAWRALLSRVLAPERARIVRLIPADQD